MRKPTVRQVLEEQAMKDFAARGLPVTKITVDTEVLLRKGGSQTMTDIVPIESIERRIFSLRGEKVMIDRNLAEMYGVETRILNQAVKRNIKRFPAEFMFQLNREERDGVITICDDLKSLKFARTM